MTGREFEVISFDCYGTLIDWETGMKNALHTILKKYNIEHNLDELITRYIEIELEVEKQGYMKYREVLVNALSKLLSEINLEFEEGDTRVFVDTLPSWPPFPETSEVLNALKSKRYKLAILSNIDNDLIRQSIDLMQVEIDVVVTAEDVESYKPAPKHWEELLNRLEMRKDKILHVSSSMVHDIIPAKQLGFKTAWINRKNQQLRGIGNTYPDYEFRDLRGLLNIL